MITIRRTEHFSWKSAFFQSALFLWTWLLLLVFCEKLSASPADIVPQGSTLLDSFAALAQREAFDPAETPEDFSGDTLYTRGQLARLLTHLVEDDPTHLSAVQKDAARATRHSAPAPRLCLAQTRLRALAGAWARHDRLDPRAQQRCQCRPAAPLFSLHVRRRLDRYDLSHSCWRCV